MKPVPKLFFRYPPIEIKNTEFLEDVYEVIWKGGGSFHGEFSLFINYSKFQDMENHRPVQNLNWRILLEP